MTPDAKMPDISPDMRDFLALLIKHGVQTEIWGMQIPVVSRRSLLRAKNETNRPKDRIDYEELTALGK